MIWMYDMSNMEMFTNKEFGSVRIIKEDGKYLFCGNDVAAALWLCKSTQTTCRSLSVRNETVRTSSAESQLIKMSFIPEGDVYRLITHSKLPGAERFVK